MMRELVGSGGAYLLPPPRDGPHDSQSVDPRRRPDCSQCRVLRDVAGAVDQVPDEVVGDRFELLPEAVAD